MSKRGIFVALAAALALAVAAGVLVGPRIYDRLRGQQYEALAADSMSTPTVAGQAAYVAADEADGAQPLMLFMHGHDADHRALTLPRLHDFAQGLVDDGWIVAASDAHGNAWGSQESQDAYAALVEHVAGKHDVSRVVVVSESMGALPGLQLVADDTIPDLAGWVGVSPVVDVDAAVEHPTIGGFIETEGGEQAIADADPAGLSFEVPLAVVVAEDDADVPPETGKVFAAEHDAEVITCSGGHVAESCYDFDLATLF